MANSKTGKVTEQSNAGAAPPRRGEKRPYEAPRILEEEVFERQALQQAGKADPEMCPGGPYTS